MSPSNNVRVQILNFHGSYLYIAVEQNLELEAKERMEIGKYKSLSTWSKSRFSHPLTACQSPLLSDPMLLVNTSNVFQLLWSLLSYIWLFDAYAALVSLPSACLRLVRKTSQMLIYSVSSQSHAKHVPYWPDSFHLRSDQSKKMFYFFSLAYFVFITDKASDSVEWFLVEICRFLETIRVNADTPISMMQKCMLHCKISNSVGSTVKWLIGMEDLADECTTYRQGWLQTKDSLCMCVCVCLSFQCKNSY